MNLKVAEFIFEAEKYGFLPLWPCEEPKTKLKDKTWLPDLRLMRVSADLRFCTGIFADELDGRLTWFVRKYDLIDDGWNLSASSVTLQSCDGEVRVLGLQCQMGWCDLFFAADEKFPLAEGSMDTHAASIIVAEERSPKWRVAGYHNRYMMLSLKNDLQWCTR